MPALGLPDQTRLTDLDPRPLFLQAAGPHDRRWPRLLLLLVVGTTFATVASIVASLVVLALAALLSGVKGEWAALWAWIDRFMSVGGAETDLTIYIPFLAALSLGLLTFALIFLSVASQLYGRPIRSFLTSAERFRWPLVAWGAAINFGLLGVLLVVQVAGGEPVTPPLFTPGAAFGAQLAYAFACVIFLYLAALAEEMIFRGWMMQQIGAFTRNVVVILVINGLLFSLIHLDPNADAVLARAATGIAFGWIVLRTGGLEFAAGAHMANNLLITLFIEPLTAADVEKRPFDIGSLGVELLGSVLLVLAVELFLRRSRRGRLVLQSA
jgi:membrane protease YdiL (CAAX protease family)